MHAGSKKTESTCKPLGLTSIGFEVVWATQRYTLAVGGEGGVVQAHHRGLGVRLVQHERHQRQLPLGVLLQNLEDAVAVAVRAKGHRHPSHQRRVPGQCRVGADDQRVLILDLLDLVRREGPAARGQSRDVEHRTHRPRAVEAFVGTLADEAGGAHARKGPVVVVALGHVLHGPDQHSG
eukprot:790430-Rhodomonas_salina.4